MKEKDIKAEPRRKTVSKLSNNSSSSSSKKIRTTKSQTSPNAARHQANQSDNESEEPEEDDSLDGGNHCTDPYVVPEDLSPRLEHVHGSPHRHQITTTTGDHFVGGIDGNGEDSGHVSDESSSMVDIDEAMDEAFAHSLYADEVQQYNAHLGEYQGTIHAFHNSMMMDIAGDECGGGEHLRRQFQEMYAQQPGAVIDPNALITNYLQDMEFAFDDVPLIPVFSFGDQGFVVSANYLDEDDILPNLLPHGGQLDNLIPTPVLPSIPQPVSFLYLICLF